jgi:ABC-type transport system involved in multi-copper enzyme maturation permease subunit
MSALLTRAADRLNPILLKEVRASLRGRWFKVTFTLVLTLALVASLGFLMSSQGTEEASRGAAYFTVVSACMALGVHGLVPFAAMLSMTAESDEHTLELLQLSGISGWRIVIGKLGSALLQMLLIVSAFAPFLTIAFLLRGVAISTVALLLLLSVLLCAAQCSAGLMLGSIARARWARIVLLLVFAFFLFQFSQVGLMFVMFAGRPMSATGGPVLAGGGVELGVFLGCLAATCVSTAIAAGRLAHPEDNQSTPMRVSVSLVVAMGIGFAATESHPNDVMTALGVTLVCASPLMLVLVTERERLPRAVAAHLPRWSRVFPLSAWLPGGGTGALFVLVHGIVLLAAYPAIHLVRFAGRGGLDDNLLVLAGAVMNAVVFLLLPTALLSRATRTMGGRVVVRLVTLLVFAAANLGPVFLAFVLDRNQWEDWIPVAAPFQPGFGKEHMGSWILLILFTTLAVAANVPRIDSAIRQLAEARKRKAAHAAPVA